MPSNPASSTLPAVGACVWASGSQLWRPSAGSLTPKPIVVFEDFGDNALIFDVYFWCEAQAERELRVIRSDIRFRIDELCREHDIVIAFPQRDVHLYAKTPIEIRASGSGSEEKN